MNNFGMPCCSSCIDETLIQIKASTVDEENFDCMVVCGPKMQIYCVSARWPGLTINMFYGTVILTLLLITISVYLSTQ